MQSPGCSLMVAEGNLVEVFSSVQGEGPHVGKRHLFIRLAGCNLHCDYCDTGVSLHVPAKWRLGAGSDQEASLLDNPVTAADMLATIFGEEKRAKHAAVSFTGGEPLIYPEFLVAVARGLSAGPDVYLETNGTLTDNLRQVLPWTRTISMDFKMPSSTGEELWDKHIEFLKLASSKDVFVKIVITAGVSWPEIARACELVRQVDGSIPLILQPQSKAGGRLAVSGQRLLELQQRAMQLLEDVRVVPQVHLLLDLP